MGSIVGLVQAKEISLVLCWLRLGYFVGSFVGCWLGFNEGDSLGSKEGVSLSLTLRTPRCSNSNPLLLKYGSHIFIEIGLPSRASSSRALYVAPPIGA